MKSNLKALVAGALATTICGCYSTWDVMPRSMESLNGYHYPEHQPRLVTDISGEPAPFETGTQLEFPGMDKPEKFSSIQVNGPAFTGTTYPDGRPISFDLRQVPVVHMRKFSGLKTGLVIGIPVGIVLIASAIIVAVAGNPDDTGDDGSLLVGSAKRRR